jgi:hypothetical protein
MLRHADIAHDSALAAPAGSHRAGAEAGTTAQSVISNCKEGVVEPGTGQPQASQLPKLLGKLPPDPGPDVSCRAAQHVCLPRTQPNTPLPLQHALS